MALTRNQMEQFSELFKDSPLLTKWSDFQTVYLPNLDAHDYGTGQTIYGPGSPPTFLYLIISGTVRETWRREGTVWLQQDYGPGQFFSPRALFLGEHESTAVAVTGTTLFRMTAADLRVATEHNTDLYDSLLQEKRASRLRRIPLVRSLTDAQVRSLAALLAEQEFTKDAKLPLADKPGLWMIDYGQIEVTGPANAGGPGWPAWRLTSGNFFTTPGAGGGANCAADEAKACLKTHCFYLASEHLKRLMAGFPDVAVLLGSPLNIAAELKKVELFLKLSAEQREHLAQYAAWEFVPAGQNVTTQGSIGHNFVILRGGAALITALDDRGRLRPRNYLPPGTSYGRASLLEGQPRDATVRAVVPNDATQLHGAELILLDRRDMQTAFGDRPELWPHDDWLVQRTIQIKEKKRPYFWMEEGETVLWQGRSHIFWLLTPLLSVMLLIGGALLVLYLAVLDEFLPTFGPNLWITMIIVIGLVVIPTLIWLLVDYFNDYYVVTNRRVTRRDRVWLFYEARTEVPIDMVQDATLEQDFWGRIIGYGDLTIRTAAKPGSITFAHVPDPDDVKEEILSGKGGAVAAAFGQRKESLRRGLISGLNLALPVSERKRALGDITDNAGRRREKQPELLPGTRGAPSIWRSVAGIFPASWQKVLVGPPKPAPKPLSGQIVWRKSWVNLLMRGGMPFTFTALWILMGIALLIVGVSSTPVEPVAVLLVWFFTFLILGGWAWWQWEDWHNDIYVLTDDQIIDMEQRPLGLSTKRRASGLDRVQTVDSNQEGLLPNLLNYGNVIVRTAAGDEGFTFTMVANPKYVQATVFQKLAAFQRRQEQKRTDDRQRDLIEGLDVYHELRQSSLSEGIRIREGR